MPNRRCMGTEEMTGSEQSIWWIRRDLRLNDNTALAKAATGGRTVLPLFILDPRLTGLDAEKRLRFLYSGLHALDAELKKLGSRLFLRTGDPAQVLGSVASELGETKVYAEEDFTPFSRRRDADAMNSVQLELTGGLTVVHPAKVLNREGRPYRVFSQFKKRWEELAGEVSVRQTRTRFAAPDAIDSEPLPSLQGDGPDAGEAVAERMLDRFVSSSGLENYASDRSRVDSTTTSGLSPFIRFGMISARQLVATAQAAAKGETETSARSWLSEVIWREFFQSAIYHFPESTTRCLRPEFEGIEWRNNPDELAAWREGRTGYPVVDAAMRQLQAEGWIHNRLRMIVASFLVKDLLIDWRLGANWFMRQLIDGDTAANIGGWQWTAGTGLDAAPYFRVFNPVLQGRKFDPHGDYVRRWVPEVASVPDRFLHNPWDWPELQSAKIDYPPPIVEHKAARQRALDAFNAAKSSYTG